MQFLLLSKADGTLFEESDVAQVFRSNARFRDVRFHTPGGDLIACTYVEPNDWTLINLDTDRKSIFFSSAQGAAIHAVLIIQQALGEPMRVFNDDYTFDLTFSGISSVEELEAAMENARTN